MAAYDGKTKADIIRGLSGNAEAKCKCLGEIADLGPDAARYFGYASEVTRCLKDTSHAVKCAALRALASMGPAGASDADVVGAFLKNSDVELKCCALSALGGFGPHSAAYEQEVAGFLADQLPELRAAAAGALGEMQAIAQTMPLKACFKDPDSKVLASVLVGVGHFGESGALFAADVGNCLSHQDSNVRLAAIEALTKIGEGSEKQASKVVSCLADSDGIVRQAAITYFETVPLGMVAFKLVEQISPLLVSSDGRAQAAAAVSLAKLHTNHEVLIKRLKSQSGEIPSKAKALDIDTTKLIALLSSQFEDEASLVLAAACVQPKPPLEMRMPASAAAATLAFLHCADAVQPIVSQLTNSSSKEVIASFLKALGTIGDLPESVCTKIAPFLNDSSAEVRAGACLAFGGVAGDSAAFADSVASKMLDPHPVVRGAAAVGVSKMSEGSKYSNRIGSLLDDSIPTVQKNAIIALGYLGEKGEIYASKVCKLATTGDVSVRVMACEVLSGMGSRGAAFAEEIAMLLEDPDGSVRTAAQNAQAKMGRNDKPAATPTKAIADNSDVGKALANNSDLGGRHGESYE